MKLQQGTKFMLRPLSLILAASLLLGSLTLVGAQTDTQSSNEIIASEAVSTSGTFTKKRYTVKGHWEIVEIDGKKAIRFTDDFKTKNGPDLKVYLSPKSITEVTRKTATEGSRKIGVLKSNNGSQTYTLPDGVRLSDYKSVLVHCEAYSVLWGGFDIP